MLGTREILAIEPQALVDMDFEIELTGFEMAEVDLILDEATEIKQTPLPVLTQHGLGCPVRRRRSARYCSKRRGR